MKTLVALENSNCTWCHNEMLGTLRGQDGVRLLRSDFSSGCLVIEHEDDPDALLALITTTDRAMVVAGNGEREMVPVDGHQVAACLVANDVVGAPPDKKGSTARSTRSPGMGTKSSTPPFPPDRWSRAVAACPVCHPDGSGGREGVRVLTRDRSIHGPVLRAARFVMRKYRVAFHLPMAPR